MGLDIKGMSRNDKLAKLRNTPQAAAYIGRSVAFLNHDRLKEVPTIEYVRIGYAVRYQQDVLDAYLQGHINRKIK